MRLRSITLSTFALLLLAGASVAGDGAMLDYQNEYDFIPTTPGVHGGAAGAFASPAAWAMTDRTGNAFWWDDQDHTSSRLENWGWSWGKTLGLAVQHHTYARPGGDLGVTDWQVGYARGGRGHATALAWRWHTGDGASVGREKHLVFSTLHRPGRHLSFGLNAAHSVESSARQGVVDLGFRPFGTPAVTLFGDYALRNGQSLDEGGWGAGVALRPVPGLMMALKLRDVPGTDDLRTTFAVGVTLGRNGLHVLPGYDHDGEHLTTSYLLETQAPRSPLPVDPADLFGDDAKRYVTLDLHDRHLTYQNYRWFDGTRLAWLDLARLLDALLEDEDVDGLALNLAGFSGRPSLIWEFRAALGKLQDAGKDIVVHMDRGGMLMYGLASVADDLSIDPQGMITLPGIDLSRTYMKDLLEQVGLGFEALQYFDHKTAVEVLSRDDMSPADREQRGRIVDVIYEEVRRAVVAGRGLDDATFDAVVDDTPVMTPRMLIDQGLADRTARWHQISEWLSEERRGVLVGPDPEYFRVRYDDAWGEPPRIAVVYALGECAMETGIRGRATSEYLEGLIHDPGVAAVVLRADSPGGDPLPSDLIADAVRRLKEAGKPVVVSQGDVAASGGYWISMDGSEVLTTPLTITGSIGVISGWLWDESLHEKAGVSADGVSRGQHADAFRSVRYPLFGINVPARALTPEESAYYKDLILALYDDFVVAVADGRDLDQSKVREIGGGRVWMGGDAVDLGLCDAVGGLSESLDTARRLAGLAADAEVVLEEYPRRKLFKMPSLGPSLPGMGADLGAALPVGGFVDDDAPLHPTESLLRLLADMNGRPGLLLLPDALPEAWRQGDTKGLRAP